MVIDHGVETAVIAPQVSIERAWLGGLSMPSTP